MAQEVLLTSASIEITPDELATFHATHFSTESTTHFATHFLGPVEDSSIEDGCYVYEEEEEDDGLGYYPDGQKRTLTDEQIAMFRFSEVEALLRERRHAMEAGESSPPASRATPTPTTIAPSPSSQQQANLKRSRNSDSVSQDTGGDYTEGGEEGKVQDGIVQGSKAKKRRKSKHPGVRNLHKKPDLRKRTWDIVEKDGMGTEMDYGEEEEVKPKAAAARSQRKVVSYDDV